MASKGSEEYFENIQGSDRILALIGVIEFTDDSVPSAREVITEAFDAGATEVCKKILEETKKMWQEDSDYFSDLEGIIKDLGVEL